MEEERNNLPIFWLWTAGLSCLLLSTSSVLRSFGILVHLIIYATGYQVPSDPRVVAAMEKILASPHSTVGITAFNCVLWLLATIFCINLLRLREWSRISLLTVIGIDLLMTLFVAVVNAYRYQTLGSQGYEPTAEIGVMTTILEVAISIVLCHPRISELTRGCDSDHPPHSPHQDRPWDRS